MKLYDLCESLLYGTTVKVLSASTGRVLLVNANSTANRAIYASLDVHGIKPYIQTNKDGGYARPMLICYASPYEYDSLKKGQTV